MKDNVKTITDPYGYKIVYRYYETDDHVGEIWRVGDLTSEATIDNTLTQPEGNYVEYTYIRNVGDTASLMKTRRDIRGEEFTYTYYGEDVNNETDPNKFDKLLRITSPNIDTDGDGVLDSQIILQEFVYDQMSGADIKRMTQKMGDGLAVTEYEFEVGGEEVTTEKTSGLTTIYQFLTDVPIQVTYPDGGVKTMEYAANLRPGRTVDQNGHVSELQWDANGENLLRSISATGEETTYSYNANGDIENVTHPDGTRIEHIYGVDDGTINYTRLVIEQRMYDADDNLMGLTKYTHNGQHRVTSKSVYDPTDLSENTLIAQTLYGYGQSGNANGKLETVTIKDLDPITANDELISYIYDASGRVIKVGTSSMFGTCKYQYTVYDPAGNVLVSACSPHNISGDIDETNIDDHRDVYPEEVSVTKFEYDALGRNTKITTDAGSSYERVHVKIFDSLGRVIKIISNFKRDGLAAPGNWHYDYTSQTWVDGAGGTIYHGINLDENIITETAYNARNKVRLTRNVLGQVTLYGYDEGGNMVRSIVNAVNLDTNGDYNNDYGADPKLESYGALSTKADEEILADMVYDLQGTLVHTTSVAGTDTVVTYDALNRPTKIVTGTKSTARIDLNLGDTDYDATLDPRSSGYMISEAPDRDLITMIDYDPMGRVVRERVLVDNRFSGEQWATTLYGYDKLGRMVRVISAASDPDYPYKDENGVVTAKITNYDTDLSSYAISADTDQDIVRTMTYNSKLEYHFIQLTSYLLIPFYQQFQARLSGCLLRHL